jgi:5'-nucleotidase
MNILLTNDDGISSDGLLLLAQALREETGHGIYVLAPDTNRSGVSHSISITSHVRIRPEGEREWVCSGTPADCVMVAALGEVPVIPDLVISGINAGANMGTDLVYSGTAAAARQAGLLGIPGIALSLAGHGEPFYWEPAITCTLDNLDKWISFWKDDIFVNVNFPNNPGGYGEPVITYPSRRHYHDTMRSFQAPDGYQYCFVEGGALVTEDEQGSDWDAVSKNLVSVSPVFLHPVVREDLCGNAPAHSAAGSRAGVVTKRI